MLNTIFDTLLPLFGIVRPELVSIDKMYAIPVKVAKKVNKAPKQEKGSTVRQVDKDTNTWECDIPGKSDLDGAVQRVTDYDFTVLKQRGFPHKGTHWTAICEVKKQWFDGKSVDQAAQYMNYSASWIEKRFACFSSALEMERGDVSK